MALLNFFRSINKILPWYKPENYLQQWPKSVEIFVDAIEINKLPKSCKWHFWRHDCFNKWPQKGNWERHADKAQFHRAPLCLSSVIRTAAVCIHLVQRSWPRQYSNASQWLVQKRKYNFQAVFHLIGFQHSRGKSDLKLCFFSRCFTTTVKQKIQSK